MKITIIMTALLLFGVLSCKKPAEVVENTQYLPVKLYSVKETASAEELVLSGRITTENENRPAFKVGGVIDRIFVEEGQPVVKGQLLARLKLTEIDAQVVQAKLGYEKSIRDYNRINNLYKDSVATFEQLQNSRTALEIAGKTLEQANFNKKYAVIYASSPGFISKKTANEGEIVQGGAPILHINENNKDSSWIVKIGVSDNDWLKINVNDSCTIMTSSGNYDGFVSQKNKAIDPNSGTFQIEVKIKKAADYLASGMFAKVRVNLKSTSNNYTIPYEALLEANGNKAFVMVPVSDTTVRKVAVTIKSFDRNTVVIDKGLENVSAVIIGNSPFLNEKSKIKIIR